MGRHQLSTERSASSPLLCRSPRCNCLPALCALPWHLVISAGLCSILAAPCGGTVHNATIGRVLSPSYTGNQSSSMYCVWVIGAPPGQKLHLHFEKLLLTEKDR